MPRVSALVVIGLDYTVQDVKWGEQKESIIRVVSEVMVPESLSYPIFVTMEGMDQTSYMRRLIFGQHSSPHQKVHLHFLYGYPL